MFDLNLAIGSISVEDESYNSGGGQSQLSSGDGNSETSSVDGEGCSSRASPVSGGDTRACTLNFVEILDGGTHGQAAPGLVTRELFPVSEANTAADLRRVHPRHDEQEQRVKAKKSRRGPRSRSSQYRGVTFYRRTGRWESHIWDCGKQVYLGGFDTALSAARAYDRAAVKFRGVEADINFSVNDYEDDMKKTKNLSKQEFVQILRRQNPGFSRGSSKYRGITAFHKCARRWEPKKEKLLSLKDGEAMGCCFERDVVIANLESSNNLISESCRAEKASDLELNLGISTSPPKGSHSSLSFPLHSNYVVQDPASFKMYKQNPVSMRSNMHSPWLTGVPVDLQQSTNRPSPKNEEIANRALHRHDRVGCQVWTSPFGAASSGFSSRTTAVSDSYPFTLNLSFSSPTNESTNHSPFHSQIITSFPRHN